MPRHQTLASRGLYSDRTPLDDMVDQVIAIRRVWVGESRTYGAYADMVYDVLEDVEAGEIRDSALRSVSYGEAVVRTLTQWLGDDENGKEISPALVVKVARQGRVHLLIDLDSEPPPEQGPGPDDHPF